MNTPLPLSCSPIPLSVYLAAARVACGFPSPAEDQAAERIDLNRILVGQPLATFVFRARGRSMIEAGINDGDYVVVDRSLEARNGDVVLAVVDGEFTLKILDRRAGRVRLLPANPTCQPIVFKPDQELVVWGVATWTLKPHRPVASR